MNSSIRHINTHYSLRADLTGGALQHVFHGLLFYLLELHVCIYMIGEMTLRTLLTQKTRWAEWLRFVVSVRVRTYSSIVRKDCLYFLFVLLHSRRLLFVFSTRSVECSDKQRIRKNGYLSRTRYLVWQQLRGLLPIVVVVVIVVFVLYRDAFLVMHAAQGSRYYIPVNLFSSYTAHLFCVRVGESRNIYFSVGDQQTAFYVYRESISSCDLGYIYTGSSNWGDTQEQLT